MDELGLFLVNQVMDGVEYQRKNECNTLIMSKETHEAVEAEADAEVIEPDRESRAQRRIHPSCTSSVRQISAANLFGFPSHQ